MITAPVLEFTPAFVQALQVIFWAPMIGAIILFAALVRKQFNR